MNFIIPNPCQDNRNDMLLREEGELSAKRIWQSSRSVCKIAAVIILFFATISISCNNPNEKPQSKRDTSIGKKDTIPLAKDSNSIVGKPNIPSDSSDVLAHPHETKKIPKVNIEKFRPPTIKSNIEGDTTPLKPTH
jgi:hypothetical protein